HLAEHGTQQCLADAAAALLGRDGDRAYAGERHALAAHERVERIQHERADDLAVELADAHVANREAWVIGVELAPLLEARHAIRAMAEIGQRLDIGAPSGAVTQRGRPRRATHRRRSSTR